MGATAAMGVMSVSSAANAYSTAQAQRAQGEYTQGIYETNAKFAAFNATDSLERGEFLAGQIKRKSDRDLSIVRKNARVIQGQQRASLAAQGIEITSGSAADILEETKTLSALDETEIKRNAELDAITVKANAWREAWGYQTQAIDYAARGRFARMAGDNSSRNTLLTGGLQATAYGLEGYSQYTYRKKK